MRIILLLILAIPAAAQFRSIDIRFEGIGCASCMESLPGRLQRIRGVESASVDAGMVKVRLTSPNRVRVEQVRDAIEQDGTQARSAAIIVVGELTREEGKWLLKPAGGSAIYEVEAAQLAAGKAEIEGNIPDLHPAGPLTIHATRVTKRD